MRNFFVELDGNRRLDFSCLKERLCRADSQVVVSLRDRWIVAAKLDSVPTFIDSELIIERNWGDERVELVEAVVPPAKDFQRQIDLRRSENLHIVMSSLREKSRSALAILSDTAQ